MSDIERNLKEELLHFGRKNVNMDYHELSNTHIAYCMAIGRQGTKGFGHSADMAFERFIQQLAETVSDAPSSELSYWSKRCDLERDAALKRSEVENLTREPLSLQIGMAVPMEIEKAVSANARKRHLSRNQLVTNLLSSGHERLEKRLENEPSQLLREEIKSQSGKGEESWSQHVTADLQARLMLLAKRFDISVALLTRYLLVKAHRDSEDQSAMHHPAKRMVAGAFQVKAHRPQKAKSLRIERLIPVQNSRVSLKSARNVVRGAFEQLKESKSDATSSDVRAAKKTTGPTKGKAFAARKK